MTNTTRRCEACGDPIPDDRPRSRYCRKDCSRTTQAANSARTTKRTTQTVYRFVGIDGEGVDRPDGAHDYNLLSIGSDSLYHPDGRVLDLDEIFMFLWNYGINHPKDILVGYFLGYDYSQWFRQLPEDRARMLYTTAGQAIRRRKGPNPAPFPVRWKRWEFDLLGSTKRLKLRLIGTKQWVYVVDAAPFFQSSLLRAIDPADWAEPICTPGEYEQITQGKADRGQGVVPYGTPVDPVTVAYNVLENDVLSRLMNRLRQGFTSFGVKLRRTQWHGPGQAAQAWLSEVAPDHTGEAVRAVTPEHVMIAARSSYYGGWFEIFAHGPMPGSVWEYDINSAYPFEIARLPCLLHGEWVDGSGPDPDARLALIYGIVRGSDPVVGAMTHRTAKGAVLRPRATRGWFWQHEVDAAQAAGVVDSIEVEERWQYYACGCPPPMAGIADLYQLRIRDDGRHKNTPEGKALKLVYNSAYGKMAQSIGAPRFANAIYASLITAGCRTQILHAIASHPNRTRALVMVATDGVYFTEPHPGLRLSPTELGAWDETEKADLCLFKPGVYWSTRSGALAVKSRGVGGVAFTRSIPDLTAAFAEVSVAYSLTAAGKLDVDWPSADVLVPFSIVSPRDALNRGDWPAAGAIVHDTINVQSADPYRKRRPFVLQTRHRPDTAIRLVPYPQGDRLESTPYDKEFGADQGPMTPDGPAAILLMESIDVGSIVWG